MVTEYLIEIHTTVGKVYTDKYVNYGYLTLRRIKEKYNISEQIISYIVLTPLTKKNDHATSMYCGQGAKTKKLN